MHLYPICFIRQWNHSIQMHVNSYNAGHRTLCWQRDGGDVRNEATIDSSSVTLDCFTNEGVYWFWTISPTGTPSRRMRVYIRCETPKQIIDKILGYADIDTKSKWALKILTNLYRDFGEKPSIPLVHYLCDYMANTKDIADYESFDALYDELGREESWLIEEVLQQHPDNAKVYPNAINCLRIITVVDKKGEPHVIFATQKYGLNGRVVDNYGFGTRVDLETGKICSPGVSGDGSMGIVYDEHPMTHVKLVGYQVPMFKEACELAKAASKVVPQVRYVGWDIAITPDGPAVVEGNNYCAHDFWQLPAQTPEKTGILPVFEAIEPDLKVR